MTGPELRWVSEPENPHAVVLVLHGGRVASPDLVRWHQLAVLRMVPFAWAVRKTGHGRIAVARLRFEVRGWNDGAPVADARWALAQLRERHPGRPIGLLGHSMGARTVLRLLADGAPDVQAAVTLAAWVDPDDRVAAPPGLPVLLMHGDRDWVDPAGSAAAATRLREAGAVVDRRVIKGSGHAMLRHLSRWHRDAAEFLAEALTGLQGLP